MNWGSELLHAWVHNNYDTFIYNMLADVVLDCVVCIWVSVEVRWLLSTMDRLYSTVAPLVKASLTDKWFARVRSLGVLAKKQNGVSKVHPVWNGYIILLKLIRYTSWWCASLSTLTITADVCWRHPSNCSTALPKVFSWDLQVCQCIRNHIKFT